MEVGKPVSPGDDALSGDAAQGDCNAAGSGQTLVEPHLMSKDFRGVKPQKPDEDLDRQVDRFRREG